MARELPGLIGSGSEDELVLGHELEMVKTTDLASLREDRGLAKFEIDGCILAQGKDAEVEGVYAWMEEPGEADGPGPAVVEVVIKERVAGREAGDVSLIVHLEVESTEPVEWLGRESDFPFCCAVEGRIGGSLSDSGRSPGRSGAEGDGRRGGGGLDAGDLESGRARRGLSEKGSRLRGEGSARERQRAAEGKGRSWRDGEVEVGVCAGAKPDAGGGCVCICEEVLRGDEQVVVLRTRAGVLVQADSPRVLSLLFGEEDETCSAAIGMG